MMPKNSEILDLDTIAASDERSVVLRGKTYVVHPLDGFGFKLLAGLNDSNSIDAMYTIAARSLAPALSKDEVIGSEDTNGLSASEVALVVRIAGGAPDVTEG